MNTYLTIFLITALTGVGGLTLGGVLAAAVHSPSDRTVSLLLRFTTGVMLSVACFDLIPDSVESSGSIPALCWLLAGYCCTCLLNGWVDKRAHHGGHHHRHGGGGESCACGKHSLRTAGLVLAAAVALHNLPVGIAIGAAFGQTALPGHAGHAGILAALIIGLHNIPEGMSIAAPLLSGGEKPAKALGAAAVSGLPTILGAMLGYAVGAVNQAALGASLSFAAGAMLYVALHELLPESEHLWQHKLGGAATMLGLLAGMALIFAHAH